MSETPRENAGRLDGLDKRIAQLETELAEANTEIARLRKEHKAMSKGAQTNALVAKSLAGKLADAKAELADLQQQLDASCNAEELRQVRQERDAARKDSELLDWMIRQRFRTHPEFIDGDGPFWTVLKDRAAINAAMSEDK